MENLFWTLQICFLKIWAYQISVTDSVTDLSLISEWVIQAAVRLTFHSPVSTDFQLFPHWEIPKTKFPPAVLSYCSDVPTLMFLGFQCLKPFSPTGDLETWDKCHRWKVTAFGHWVSWWWHGIGRQVVGDAGAGEGYQGLGWVTGLLLDIIRVNRHQAWVSRSGPEVGLFSQAPQIFLKMGIEEDVEKGIEAGRKRDNHQEDKLNYFRADKGEV